MLTLKNLSLTAADAQGRADIVKNVSLDVEDGKFLVITGPNGGGKVHACQADRRHSSAPTGGPDPSGRRGHHRRCPSPSAPARRGQLRVPSSSPSSFKGHDRRATFLRLAAGQASSRVTDACAYLCRRSGLCARDYLEPRRRRQPVRRRAQAHRDRHAPRAAAPGLSIFRRARGGHRSVVACQDLIGDVSAKTGGS